MWGLQWSDMETMFRECFLTFTECQHYFLLRNCLLFDERWTVYAADALLLWIMKVTAIHVSQAALILANCIVTSWNIWLLQSSRIMKIFCCASQSQYSTHSITYNIYFHTFSRILDLKFSHRYYLFNMITFTDQ